MSRSNAVLQARSIQPMRARQAQNQWQLLRRAHLPIWHNALAGNANDPVGSVACTMGFSGAWFMILLSMNGGRISTLGANNQLALQRPNVVPVQLVSRAVLNMMQLRGRHFAGSASNVVQSAAYTIIFNGAQFWTRRSTNGCARRTLRWKQMLKRKQFNGLSDPLELEADHRKKYVRACLHLLLFYGYM